jgi:hypothetical protein
MQMTIVAIHPEALCMAKLLTFGTDKQSDSSEALSSGRNISPRDQKNGKENRQDSNGNPQESGKGAL